MKFSPIDTQRIQSFYQALLEQHGTESAQSLSWQDDHVQQVRFAVLTDIGRLEGMRILDVGCGLGDLYGYLFREGVSCDYTGIDIVPDLIAVARRKYPQAHFETLDISQADNIPEFDYIFASGTFTYAIDKASEVYWKIIEKMFLHARKGIAFNMLRSSSAPYDPAYVSYDPHEVYERCLALTDRLVIRQDYLAYDFTVYLYH